jgi:hypothetical protein
LIKDTPQHYIQDCIRKEQKHAAATLPISQEVEERDNSEDDGDTSDDDVCFSTPMIKEQIRIHGKFLGKRIRFLYNDSDEEIKTHQTMTSLNSVTKIKVFSALQLSPSLNCTLTCLFSTDPCTCSTVISGILPHYGFQITAHT